LAERVRTLGDNRPRIHLDVYGTIGELFERHISAISDYLGHLNATVGSLELLWKAPF